MPDDASCVMCQSKVVNKQRTRISLQTGLELDQRGAHLSALISEYQLELELVQSHMAQKPMLRGEVGCACVARGAARLQNHRHAKYGRCPTDISLFLALAHLPKARHSFNLLHTRALPSRNPPEAPNSARRKFLARGGDR